MACCIPVLFLIVIALPVCAVVPPNADSDGDGLSDFVEKHKYFTDPAKADSDGDGKPDGDWEERREFTYSIRTLLRVMRPYDLASMNDDYQDARQLRDTAEFGEFEIIHYPLNTAADAIGANDHWQREYSGMQEWLKPGITTNWTPEMRAQLLAELHAAGIDPACLNDRQLAERVSKWMNATCKYPGYMYTTAFIEYSSGRPQLVPGCEEAYQREKGEFGWSFEEQLEHEVFGAGMFKHKTRGTCGSSAIYWTTIFRAIGLPARHVFCIPAVDGNDAGQIAMLENGITHHRVRQTVLRGMERVRGNCAHAFNEVFVGGRWVRLNYDKLGQGILDADLFGLVTHLLTYRDRSELPMAQTWGLRYARNERSAEFPTANPYKALQVSDGFGQHARIPNPPVETDGHEVLTIDHAYWLDSPEKPAWLDVGAEFRDREQRAGRVIAFVHTAEWIEGRDYRQYHSFLRQMDGTFTLRSPGQPDIPATIDGSFFTSNDNRAIALLIAKEDDRRMKPGAAYELVPANGKSKVKWVVRSGVTLNAADRTDSSGH